MAPEFTITVRGDAHEVYIIDVESERVAREMFERGELTDPVTAEVEGAEITDVRQG